MLLQKIEFMRHGVVAVAIFFSRMNLIKALSLYEPQKAWTTISN